MKVEFIQVPKRENGEADSLAKAAFVEDIIDKKIEIRYIPSVDIPKVQQVDGETNWTVAIISYLRDGLLPKDKEEAQKLRIRATRFVLMDEVLYKRGFSQLCLRCLTPDESNNVLRDIHEGACENHSRARAFIHKIIQVGYYWLSMQADAKSYVQACDKCQRFSNVPRQPSKYLTPMMAPQLLPQWGLDILGPFPTGTRQMKVLVVGIDYFTKWVEVEPLARITEQNIRSFI